jgi:hypothetical protein
MPYLTFTLQRLTLPPAATHLLCSYRGILFKYEKAALPYTTLTMSLRQSGYLSDESKTRDFPSLPYGRFGFISKFS